MKKYSQKRCKFLSGGKPLYGKQPPMFSELPYKIHMNWFDRIVTKTESNKLKYYNKIPQMKTITKIKLMRKIIAASGRHPKKGNSWWEK